MQNSGISSRGANSTNPSPAGPTRKRFSLAGPSWPIDPRVDAVRRDLADIRLADRVFAPHYAAPLPRNLARAATLRAAPAGDALTDLEQGEVFEVLEFAGSHAWGVARGAGLVGYLDAAALESARA